MNFLLWLMRGIHKSAKRQKIVFKDIDKKLGGMQLKIRIYF